MYRAGGALERARRLAVRAQVLEAIFVAAARVADAPVTCAACRGEVDAAMLPGHPGGVMCRLYAGQSRAVAAGLERVEAAPGLLRAAGLAVTMLETGMRLEFVPDAPELVLATTARPYAAPWAARVANERRAPYARRAALLRRLAGDPVAAQLALRPGAIARLLGLAEGAP